MKYARLVVKYFLGFRPASPRPRVFLYLQLLQPSVKIRAVPCKIVNLEQDRPTVNVGLLRMERALVAARAEHVALLKLIHGYGSSGVGGILREEVWKSLDRFKRNGFITDFIAGEDFRLSNEASWELVKRDKSLKEDRDFGRANRGITIVVL
jgi:hypothetical protein